MKLNSLPDKNSEIKDAFFEVMETGSLSGYGFRDNGSFRKRVLKLPDKVGEIGDILHLRVITPSAPCVGSTSLHIYGPDKSAELFYAIHFEGANPFWPTTHENLEFCEVPNRTVEE
ncbi:MAG: hypothetical protein WAW39_20390 [Prosthecobacter sp.]|uniref:hypothetical protein n=1 Tax=Prosthecobacter sp. TaxID=1965333 RepID=UPI003BAF08C5